MAVTTPVSRALMRSGLDKENRDKESEKKEQGRPGRRRVGKEALFYIMFKR